MGHRRSTIRSVQNMGEDIGRTLPYKRTEVLAPVALAEQSTKSPPIGKAHDEQLPAQYPPPPTLTA